MLAIRLELLMIDIRLSLAGGDDELGVIAVG